MSDLTQSQKKAIEVIKTGRNVFLTGAAGCGKSFLVKYIARELKKHKVIAVTSTTGVSALHVDGVTLHSWAGIGLGTGSIGAIVTKIKKKPYLRKRWNNVEILIIDEVSMLSGTLFEKLNKIAKIVRKSELPFGGIQILVTGDFLQLPVVENADDFCFTSEAWKECIKEVVILKDNMRQLDATWRHCLEEIRFGEISNSTKRILKSRVNKKLKNAEGILPTLLFPLNVDVDYINEIELNKIVDNEEGNTIYEYEIITQVYKMSDRTYVESLQKHLPCKEKLQLAKGAQVMLLHNLEIDDGLINGSRGVIVDFVEDLPIVRFLNGVTRLIDYHIWEVERDDKKLASFEMIPLKLAYALTIHKGQGCSLDYVITDLENVFEFGMGYVALGRARTLEGLSIRKLNYKKIKAHPIAIKFYKEINSNEEQANVEIALPS